MNVLVTFGDSRSQLSPGILPKNSQKLPHLLLTADNRKSRLFPNASFPNLSWIFIILAKSVDIVYFSIRRTTPPKSLEN